ncbi:hypothetical protein ABFS83_02G122000 [Erythranthe nasuta]
MKLAYQHRPSSPLLLQLNPYKIPRINHRTPQKLQILWEKGLFALAPPHQGIDGDWSDESGVIVYKWNERDKRPNTGRPNWKRRWSCCAEYDVDASPCRRGPHVSYDDGFTLY